MQRQVFKITKPLAKLKNERKKINKKFAPGRDRTCDLQIQLPVYMPLDQGSQFQIRIDIQKRNAWAMKYHYFYVHVE